MTDDLTPELRKELLDDFYAECDELLNSLRGALSELEGAKAGSDPLPILQSVYRTLHTLKGSSAIVGLREGERIAHAAEDVLKDLTRKNIELNGPIIDSLQTAAQLLEQTIGAHRSNHPLPANAALISALEKHRVTLSRPHAPQAEGAEPAPSAARKDPFETCVEKGLTAYIARFSPSQERDSRGINVNAIRERLQGLGEVLRVTPVVKGKGQILFEFVVGCAKAPSIDPSWAEDGLELEVWAPAISAQSEGATMDSMSLSPSHLVRVDLARLDELMRITGEMVIQRSRLEERIKAAGDAGTALGDINIAFARSLREMRRAITDVRMVPIGEVFSRMPYVVRDLSREYGKPVRMALEGQRTEVDKYVVERLKEPLLHLVRNALVHGIEEPGVRKEAGKPPEATVSLAAESHGESITIRVRDDGGGVNFKAVAAKALALRIPVPEKIDSSSILAILCSQGFSTREATDRAGGRGVGMAVVAQTVRELGGVLSMKSQIGVGTEFVLTLPLTLSIAEAIIFSVGTETGAFVQSAVSSIIQVPAADARTIHSTRVVPYRDGLLPVRFMRQFCGMPEASDPLLTIVVLRMEEGAFGVVVDCVRSQREIVIRAISDPLLRVPGIAAVTELGDGRPVLIYDPAAIGQGVLRPADLVDAGTPEISAPL